MTRDPFFRSNIFSALFTDFLTPHRLSTTKGFLSTTYFMGQLSFAVDKTLP